MRTKYTQNIVPQQGARSHTLGERTLSKPDPPKDYARGGCRQ